MSAVAIPGGEAAFCMNCEVFFNVRNLVCPTCACDSGFYLVMKKVRQTAVLPPVEPKRQHKPGCLADECECFVEELKE